jgi:hypothetical protein
MCCGKKREGIRQQTVFVTPTAAPPKLPEPRVLIGFKGIGSYLAAGQHSGEVYHFSQERTEMWIDAKDVSALLMTGFFKIQS